MKTLVGLHSISMLKATVQRESIHREHEHNKNRIIKQKLEKTNAQAKLEKGNPTQRKNYSSDYIKNQMFLCAFLSMKNVPLLNHKMFCFSSMKSVPLLNHKMFCFFSMKSVPLLNHKMFCFSSMKSVPVLNHKMFCFSSMKR